MKLTMTKPEHEASYQDIIALLKRHPDLTPYQMLAVASNLVGKLSAMQDQRTVSNEDVMATVQDNIEYGNKQILDKLGLKPEGHG